MRSDNAQTVRHTESILSLCSLLPTVIWRGTVTRSGKEGAGSYYSVLALEWEEDGRGCSMPTAVGVTSEKGSSPFSPKGAELLAFLLREAKRGGVDRDRE